MNVLFVEKKDVYAEKYCSECGQRFDWDNTQ